MRWVVMMFGLLGCEPAVCPPGAPGPLAADAAHACASRGEACGRDTACSIGLTCVPIVLCTIGPCPGVCLEACDDDDQCRTDEICEAGPLDNEADTWCVSP